MGLDSHRRGWEDLAVLDPLWAIKSDEGKQHGGWGEDEFFQTGKTEVQQVLSWAREKGFPARSERALDYGCGVGRLTRALAAEFDACDGLDISQTMIDRARQMNPDLANVSFRVGDASAVNGAQYDLVITLIVLQHLPTRSEILNTIEALCRCVTAGGVLILGIPGWIPVRHRIQLRPRMYSLMRAVGVRSEILYRTLGLYAIRMQAVPEPRMQRALQEGGLEVVDRRTTTHGSGVRSSVYLAARPQLPDV